MPVPTLPAFPDDIPTHPLLVIDYELIRNGDTVETGRLWDAATKLGFWYLKNHGADELVAGMFDLGAETIALPLEERMKFEQGDEGQSFGYKAAGVNAVDASGEPDTVEFLNIAKDDALAWPKQARRAYPRTANARMESTVGPFVRKSLEINNCLLDIFNEKLGLPPGALMERHKMEELSGSETRITRNAPTTNTTKQAIGSHTDFGSLSFLHNRLGGLQVLVPGSDSWQYVKPIPGHAICNVGDALAIFNLRSPPPGSQAGLERWSLVYFTRPGNSVVLRALVEDSTLIADAVAKTPEKDYETGATALEWFTRRIKYQRINNRKGPETWVASRGTERVEA
ncbi:hypothetical protein NLJ89_g10288 [Agrocybe chaxingu]|uniref:Clavaminate synthase-like protein n=1 Tax=Agrocybe chaxingu TaxID=84603 RepID=A0A9W8JYF9_9AGAR|nr:hypothetical protein NLJ89_g10288 [Agrocybe chaxingu]